MDYSGDHDDKHNYQKEEKKKAVEYKKYDTYRQCK